MPGFYGNFNAKICNSETNTYSEFVSKSICFDKFQLQICSINKFLDDKLCHEDTDYIIIIEGVIFNKIELYLQYNSKSLIELVKKIHCEKGETFFECFRGSFSGLLFDKNKHQIIIFTDHIGDKPIFYSEVANQLYFGSELKYITKSFKENRIHYTLNLAGAYAMLTYGFLISDLTYIQEVKRLRGGTYITFDTTNGKMLIKEYHQFKYLPNTQLSDSEIIEKLDFLFSQAVKLQVGKNMEYGYEDYAALSAGLDSRMTNFAISKLKNSNFTSFTYSPIDFHDQKTSAMIVKHLMNKFIFQSNYSGDLLLDIDGSINANDGLFMYYGSAVLKDFYDRLNTQKIGIIHSGQLGDVFVGGSYNIKKIQNISSFRNLDMHSKHLSDKFYQHFDFDKFIKLYIEKEIFSIYNRGFMGINSGSNLVFQQFTETFSPFCDVEFIQFCLTIPIDKRINNYIYDKWILVKYPEAAKFKHNGTRVIGSPYYNFVSEFVERTNRKIKKMVGIWDDKKIRTVTPLNAWSNNKYVRSGLQKYFNENISLLNENPVLQSDCRILFETGTALEKNQVLTLIGVLKLLF
ncbi:MAG: hypothetical protein WCK78_02960 [Paludibacter sp.]